MRRLVGSLVVAVLVVACSGGATDDEPMVAPEPTPQATPSPEPTREPTPPPDPTLDATPPVDPLTVETTAGAVVGLESSPDVDAWLGIPYAAAPIDERRWRPPAPAEPRTEPFEATEPGASCAQGEGGITTQLLPQPSAAEDCLTLSVWAGTDAVDAPVMVWFHGGGLSSGSAHAGLYDGTNLARDGVVVVGVNYRLGTLGFLAHPDAAAESDGIAGNYGILDQAAALGWIRENIAGFGGDPGNVTVFGESGGALAVCAHLTADWAGVLFQKAILQSGYGGCVDYVGLDDAYAAGAEVVDALGCRGENELACLRDLPIEEIVAVAGVSNPVADGAVLGASLVELAASGGFPDVRLLIGTNRDEAALFELGTTDFTDEELLSRATEVFGGRAAEALALYDQPTNLERGLAFSTDTIFACWSRLLAVELADQSTPVFQYQFSFTSPSDPFGLGPTHAAEVVLLFANPGAVVGLPAAFDPETTAVSEAMQTAWTSFAATGVPTAPVEWAPVQAGDAPFMEIDTEWSMQTDFRDDRCPALAELGLLD